VYTLWVVEEGGGGLNGGGGVFREEEEVLSAASNDADVACLERGDFSEASEESKKGYNLVQLGVGGDNTRLGIAEKEVRHKERLEDNFLQTYMVNPTLGESFSDKQVGEGQVEVKEVVATEKYKEVEEVVPGMWGEGRECTCHACVPQNPILELVCFHEVVPSLVFRPTPAEAQLLSLNKGLIINQSLVGEGVQQVIPFFDLSELGSKRANKHICFVDEESDVLEYSDSVDVHEHKVRLRKHKRKQKKKRKEDSSKQLTLEAPNGSHLAEMRKVFRGGGRNGEASTRLVSQPLVKAVEDEVVADGLVRKTRSVEVIGGGEVVEGQEARGRFVGKGVESLTSNSGVRFMMEGSDSEVPETQLERNEEVTLKAMAATRVLGIQNKVGIIPTMEEEASKVMLESMEEVDVVDKVIREKAVVNQ